MKFASVFSLYVIKVISMRKMGLWANWLHGSLQASLRERMPLCIGPQNLGDQAFADVGFSFFVSAALGFILPAQRVSGRSAVSEPLQPRDCCLAGGAPPAMSHRIPPVALVADASSWLMPLLLMHLQIFIFWKGIDLMLEPPKSWEGWFWHG